jgi:hypothetical protein
MQINAQELSENRTLNAGVFAQPRIVPTAALTMPACD